MQPHKRFMDRARVQHVKTRSLHGKLAANSRTLEAFGLRWFTSIVTGSSTEQANTKTRRNSSSAEVAHLHANVIKLHKSESDAI